MTNITPQIYVASLSDYNAGRLYGIWIDATQDCSDILEQIEKMLEGSTEEVAEDWAIHDTEGFCGYDVSEHHNLEELSAVANGIDEYGAAFAAYTDCLKELISEHNDFIEKLNSEYFEEAYCHHWESEKDFALKSDVVEEIYSYNKLPSWWQDHIDWDSVANTLFQDEYQAVKANNYDYASYGIYVFKFDV